MAVRYKSYTETHTEDKGHQYHFVCECPKCNKTETITVEGPKLFAYNHGTHAQDAFPELSAAQREMLCVSGICESCWEKIFANTDESLTPDHTMDEDEQRALEAFLKSN